VACGQTEGETDGHDKLIVAFRNFASAPTNDVFHVNKFRIFRYFLAQRRKDGRTSFYRQYARMRRRVKTTCSRHVQSDLVNACTLHHDGSLIRVDSDIVMA